MTIIIDSYFIFFPFTNDGTPFLLVCKCPVVVLRLAPGLEMPVGAGGCDAEERPELETCKTQGDVASGLGSCCESARRVVKCCEETSFPLFPLLYRASPGTDCREGAGLGRGGMFCPKIKRILLQGSGGEVAGAGLL